MATTENTYTGDGSTRLYSFTFPYLAETDIRVSVDAVETTQYELANATQIRFNTAPANQTDIRIFRQTNTETASAIFANGSIVRAQDLNDNFSQALYVAQESSRSSEQAAQAYPVAAEAKNIAESAETAANSAVSTANAANTTAGSADTKADTAISTANAASTSADNAVSVANAASAAISAVVEYTLVADVASIPSNPSDGDRVEVDNSTGIESFTPLSGLPVGFVGDSTRSVRLNYDGVNSQWVFLQYLVLDPDARYLQVDGIASKSDTVVVDSSGFGTSTTRPIACFGASSSPTADSYSEIKYADVNPPVIRGDGRLTADGGFLGDLTGNVTGNVTGNLTGNVTGDVVGNVTGNLTGNADTATLASNATSLSNKSASQFVRSDQADDVDGDLTFNGTNIQASGRYRLNDNIKLQLGSNGSSDGALYCDGTQILLDLGNNVSIFKVRDGSTTRFTFEDNGDFTASGRLNGTLGSSQVRNAISLGNAGGLGTYAMLRKTSAGNASPGDEIDGNNLVYANADSVSTSSPNGRWQCMGFAEDNTAESMTTLWLRVE